MSNKIKFAVIALLLSTVFTSCEKDITYHTVTFEANGGTLLSEAKITVTEGETVPFPDAMPPEGYAPNGWYRNVELTDEWDFNDSVTADITLYASWTHIDNSTVTVTFHADGGIFYGESGGETWKVHTYIGNDLRIPRSVIKPGYVLEGWYSDAALTRRWDFFTDVVTAGGDLYAKWSASIEGLTQDNYPKVDGATSTRMFNHMVACKLLGLPYVKYGMDGETDVCPGTNENWLNGGPSFFDGIIATSQTHGAMLNLIEGKADIILRSTTASPDERAAAEVAGVTLTETPITLDAFVFFGHLANPVRSLTLEQVRGIMTKQITNWSQVGGKNATIDVYTRPRNSGSEEALRELVMGDLEPAEFPEEQVVATMLGALGEVSKNPDGISYIFKNYKDEIVGRAHEPVFSIDGIAPDATTIRNRTYPLTTEVYAIIRSDLDHSSMAYKLYEWLQSDAARGVLEECGFVPY